MRYLGLIVVFILSSLLMLAQPHQYYQFCNLDGRTQNLCVRSIAQSDDGMMWFGTEDGLFSYDGYNLFPHDMIINGQKEDNVNATLGSMNCILADGDSLLIGCNDGVLSFSLSSYTFHHLPQARHEVVHAILRIGGDIWTATDDCLYRGSQRMASCKDHIVNMAYYDGCIWLGTYNKAMRYSVKSGQMTTVFTTDTYVTSFASCGVQGLWIGTGQDVSLWNGHTSASHDIPVAKCICRDAWGNTLVGSDHGLYIIGKDGTTCSQVLHDARITNSLAGDAVWCIFRDRDDNIWIGSNGGVSLVQNNGILTSYSLPFITGESAGNQLYCICHDSKDRYWLGGTNGIVCTPDLSYHHPDCAWYRMDDARHPLRHNRVRCIMEDDGGNVWIGGDMGLCMFVEATHQFCEFHDPDNLIDWVYGIRKAGKGRLIVTTLKAAYTVRYDSSDRSLTILSQSARKDTGAMSVADRDFLREIGMQDQFFSLCRDRGTLLFGGTDRVVVFDTQKAQTRRMAPMPVVTAVRINDERFADHAEVAGGRYVFQPDDRLIQFYLSDFDNAGELLNDYYYRIDGMTDWVRFSLDRSPLTFSNLSAGTYTLLVRRTGADDDAASIFTFTVRAPWYATTLARIVYVMLFLLVVWGVWRLIQQRKRLKAERAERAAIIARAKQKEKELLDENDYLASQLRIQLVQKSGDEAELSSDERFLLDITRVIEENMDDPELNVNTLSEKSGISSKQLYRRIKSITGMTTVAYIRDQRLKKAASLLSNGSFTVSEVMYMVGFSSPSYFTRCFSEEYGKAPSEYKEQNH